jgi:hypothetical protein
VNRLTKQISLVLISSSLILHGCHTETPEEEKKKEEDKAAAAAPGTTGTGGGHYYHSYRSRPFFFPIGGWGSSRVGSSPGVRSGSVGGSVRGGFGGAAHGASS